ncbi:HutD family protein [Cytophagales bacterium LB-30]|uniref:HutD family protein n=1 Tax=Shiella aurantiaca TaxID=3058365 RepID=A0ABT8F6J1_9BACT|nr:HutD family protein [Shiella aurantiaca]MDN4165979.1 HutD family protein [Shiella aurantiaca]
MHFQHFPASHFSPSTWAGGRTTQLFIYPPEAEYKLRNFQFRLSTATVEVEKSDFTPLPGVSRELLLLEGCIRIIHEGKYTKVLSPLDTDSFQGDWKTCSEGKCTDFNQMMQGNTQGSLAGHDVQKSTSFHYHPSPNTNWLFLYLYRGKISLAIEANHLELNAGDVVVIQEHKLAFLSLTAHEDSRVVFAEVETA